MIKYWIGVASRNHVKIAEKGGFCHINHGKKAPLRRLTQGDGLVYYAPKEKMEASAKVQAFVAIGLIRPGEIYQAQQSDCFQPFRRDVDYFEAKDAAISPLLDKLSFSAGGANWGMMMRRGLFEVTKADFDLISRTMIE